MLQYMSNSNGIGSSSQPVSMQNDEDKTVRFAPFPRTFHVDRDQLLRRASCSAAIMNHHPGPSYSSILNVRRRPSMKKKLPSCNVMKTLNEEAESKGEEGVGNKSNMCKVGKNQTDNKDIASTSDTAMGKANNGRKTHKQRHKSDSELELCRLYINETGRKSDFKEFDWKKTELRGEGKLRISTKDMIQGICLFCHYTGDPIFKLIFKLKTMNPLVVT